jgi:hypothetical protein
MRSEPATAAASPSSPPRFQERDLELLWYRLATLRWRSLAVVAPAMPQLASRLLQRMLGPLGTPARTVRGVDAAQATPGRIAALCRALERAGWREGRERVMVAVPDPAELPEARDLVAACDAMFLVLLRGETRLTDVERTLALVDRGRVLGAVLAHRLQQA